MPSYSYTNPSQSGGSSFTNPSISKSWSITGPSESQSTSTQGYGPYAGALYRQLTGQLSQQPSWGQGFAGIGGQTRQYPTISTAPVWSPEQIQSRVNLANATSDQSTQGQQKQLAGTMGGRGYGSNSPLYQALSSNLGAQNLAQKTSAENQLRFGAAQTNAQQVLAEQQANVERSRAMGAEDVARLGVGANVFGTQSGAWAQQQNALLNALSRFLQPLTQAQATSKSTGSASGSLSYGGGGGSQESSGGGGGQGWSWDSPQ